MGKVQQTSHLQSHTSTKCSGWRHLECGDKKDGYLIQEAVKLPYGPSTYTSVAVICWEIQTPNHPSKTNSNTYSHTDLLNPSITCVIQVPNRWKPGALGPKGVLRGVGAPHTQNRQQQEQSRLLDWKEASYWNRKKKPTKGQSFLATHGPTWLLHTHTMDLSFFSILVPQSRVTASI